MQTKLTSWLSLIAVLALFTLQAAAQGPAPVAAVASTQMPGTIRATRIVGTVKYTDNATKVTQDLTSATPPLSQGITVKTEANSSVVLLFSNGASINLEHTSELNIETFTQDPFAESQAYEPAKATDEPSFSTTNIKLTHGSLIGNVKKLKKAGGAESKFTVTTPVGAAGIRGTTFKIVYRPSGDGRTFNFTMTTIEGNVEVVVASGGNIIPPVSVTDNKEVVLSNVEVNTATNQIVATTAGGQTVAVTAPPASVDAPVTTVQQVQAVATQLAQAVVNVVFTTPAPTPTSNSNPPPTPPPAPPQEEKKDTGTPGTTTPPTNITNPR